MILRFFKGSTGIQFVILLMTLLLLWIPAFSESRPMPLPELITPAYGFVYNLLGDLPVLYTSLAMLLVLGGGLLLNVLLSDFGITPKNSYLTAFLYVVMMSSSTAFLTLHPVLIINILGILLLRMIFVANQKEDSLKEVFMAGILAALCSLFVFRSAGMILAVWFFLIVLQVYSWRLYAVNLFGFAAVYLYVFAWYLFTDKLLEKTALYSSVFRSIGLSNAAWQLSPFEYILFGTLLLLLLFALVNFMLDVSEKLISIRRISLVLFWMLVFSVALSLLYIINPLFDIAYVLLPVAIMVTLYFTNLKKKLFGEILLLLLLVALILCRL